MQFSWFSLSSSQLIHFIIYFDSNQIHKANCTTWLPKQIEDKNADQNETVNKNENFPKANIFQRIPMGNIKMMNFRMKIIKFPISKIRSHSIQTSNHNLSYFYRSFFRTLKWREYKDKMTKDKIFVCRGIVWNYLNLKKDKLVNSTSLQFFAVAFCSPKIFWCVFSYFIHPKSIGLKLQKVRVN